MGIDMRTPLSILPDGLREEFIATSSGRMRYVTGGSGSPLFLIHGGHGCWVHWMANLAALSRHHRVYALDMPGFGMSDDIKGEVTLEAIAREVAGAMRTLRASEQAPVGLVAFSFGTLVATTVALHHAELVGRLLLVNPPGLGGVSQEVKTIQAHAAQAARTRGLRAGLQVSMRELMLCQPGRADGDALNLLEYGVTLTRFVSRSVSRSTPLFPMLAQLRMPVHVVLGENDPHQRHELEMRRTRLQELFGTENVSVVPGAAHWLQYDQPERFNTLALTFLGAGGGA